MPEPASSMNGQKGDTIDVHAAFNTDKGFDTIVAFASLPAEKTCLSAARSVCFNDTPLCSLRTMWSVLCLDLFQVFDR